ncbi:MAG: hypothetical protein DME16_08750 [Candidatus Rokuibacteriota bacterium]|nr:MAG: hypothetical protein DME16_08750 [Candidatus Rokubacteria bacterium]
MSGHSAELRRYPRARASWRVAVEMPGGRTVNRETIDVGPHGVKVKLDESVGAGSRVRLRFQPPDRKPLDVESIVWRNDSDGPVFVFVNMPDEDFERLKSLVDEHRGS